VNTSGWNLEPLLPPGCARKTAGGFVCRSRFRCRAHGFDCEPWVALRRTSRGSGAFVMQRGCVGGARHQSGSSPYQTSSRYRTLPFQTARTRTDLRKLFDSPRQYTHVSSSAPPASNAEYCIRQAHRPTVTQEFDCRRSGEGWRVHRTPFRPT